MVQCHPRSKEPERQCTYHVTLRHVRAAIIAVEKQLVLHTVGVHTVLHTVGVHTVLHTVGVHTVLHTVGVHTVLHTVGVHTVLHTVGVHTGHQHLQYVTAT
jgi:hypothetical protein